MTELIYYTCRDFEYFRTNKNEDLKFPIFKYRSCTTCEFRQELGFTWESCKFLSRKISLKTGTLLLLKETK